MLPTSSSSSSGRSIRLPWTKPSSRRRRAILGADPDQSSLQPIRADARANILDALAKGRRWLQELTSDPEASIEAIAQREGRSERSVGMLLSLAFLAPDIVWAIIDGTLPRGIGLTRLTDLPMDWSEQHRMLGLAIPDT